MAKKKLDTNVVSTKEAAANSLGLTVEHIKACKKLGSPACSTAGRYYLKELAKWYEDNKEAVTEYLEERPKEAGEGFAYWKERKEKANAIIAEITSKKLQGNTLDKEKVIQFLKQVSGSQAILLRNLSQELPHKLLGKDITSLQVELSKSYDFICNKFKEQLDKWK